MRDLSEKGSFYAQGLLFSCKRCSACCRFDAGFVFISQKDAALLCKALSITYDEFLDTHCRWVPASGGKCQLSLKEKQNFDCVFWNSGGCTVYESRPLQCRTFPFWDSVLSSESNWKMTSGNCPGMNQGKSHSEDSIKQMLVMRQMEPIIFRGI